MLIGEVFEEFINVVKENRTYTIGLIDDKQIVTLCSNKNVIGNKIDVNKPDKNNIFFEIIVLNQNFGFLWVSGKDDNLHMISKLFYESLSVRLMYELNQATLNRKISKDDELVKSLLNREVFDMHHIVSLFHELNIDRNLTRVAIYVVRDDRFNLKDIMRLKLKPDSKEIIYSLLNSHCLLIFKDIPDNCQSNHHFKLYVKKYINSLKAWDIQDCYYFVGSMQKTLNQYEYSYQNCFWLKNNISYAKDTPVFFLDHMFEYFLSYITKEKIVNVFQFYLENNKSFNMKEFIEICDNLKMHDFNLTQTAEDMYIHKNTLIYKIKKYEDIFQIDIRGSFNGKVLLSLISYGLSEYCSCLKGGEDDEHEN